MELRVFKDEENISIIGGREHYSYIKEHLNISPPSTPTTVINNTTLDTDDTDQIIDSMTTNGQLTIFNATKCNSQNSSTHDGQSSELTIPNNNTLTNQQDTLLPNNPINVGYPKIFIMFQEQFDILRRCVIHNSPGLTIERFNQLIPGFPITVFRGNNRFPKSYHINDILRECFGFLIIKDAQFHYQIRVNPNCLEHNRPRFTSVSDVSAVFLNEMKGFTNLCGSKITVTEELDQFKQKYHIEGAEDRVRGWNVIYAIFPSLREINRRVSLGNIIHFTPIFF